MPEEPPELEGIPYYIARLLEADFTVSEIAAMLHQSDENVLKIVNSINSSRQDLGVSKNITQDRSTL